LVQAWSDIFPYNENKTKKKSWKHRGMG
jgi:hypothetical protein